jgi:hypothetical protein
MAPIKPHFRSVCGSTSWRKGQRKSLNTAALRRNNHPAVMDRTPHRLPNIGGGHADLATESHSSADPIYPNPALSNAQIPIAGDIYKHCTTGTSPGVYSWIPAGWGRCLFIQAISVLLRSTWITSYGRGFGIGTGAGRRGFMMTSGQRSMGLHKRNWAGSIISHKSLLVLGLGLRIGIFY